MNSIQFLLSAALMAALPSALFAVDGVILIDQNKAMAGNVTPGDAPGFPVTISLPGSYRLDSNLMLPDLHTSAIVVQADNVTIDLNGFSIIGPYVAATGSFMNNGAAAISGNGSLTVSNGMIQGMAGYGIFAGASAHFEKLHLSNNYLGMSFYSGSARDCVFNNNRSGIEGGPGVTISNVAFITNQLGLASAIRVTNSVFINNGIGLNFGSDHGNYSANLFLYNEYDIANASAFNTGLNVCSGSLCP